MQDVLDGLTQTHTVKTSRLPPSKITSTKPEENVGVKVPLCGI